jgi:nucleoside-diphosphate-sugar epimerase
MGIETVLVTGSTGDIGSAVVAALDRSGYRVVSVDREGERPSGATAHRSLDLLDPDAVDAVVDESDADAVVHLGTLPHPEGRPGHVTYRSNAMTTYHVVEAAAEHDVERVCLASSINALGGVFQEDPMEVEYLPMDEGHPVTPRDPYAMGKRTIELQADGFARRVGPPRSVASFRFPFVADEAAMREHFVDPDRTLGGIAEEAFATRDDLFAYVALPDAVRALRRGLAADFEGHERFFLSAPDSTMSTPTPVLVDRCYPDGVAAAGEFAPTDPLIDTGKARRLLGWEPRVRWRDLAGATVTADAESVDAREAKE